MAALDFGMALARGMLPKSEKAQQDLLNLAGGRQIFKSEDWWNKAVDKQISSGYRKQEDITLYKTTSGDWKAGTRTVYSDRNAPFPVAGGEDALSGAFKRTEMSPPKDVLIKGYSRGSGNILYGYSPPSPIYETKTVKGYYEDAKKSDFTAGELKDIEVAAKRGAEQAKRTAEESKRSTRRLARGTGGLVAKAILPGDKPATGLPSLGLTGLGLTTTALGKGLEL